MRAGFWNMIQIWTEHRWSHHICPCGVCKTVRAITERMRQAQIDAAMMSQMRTDRETRFPSNPMEA